MSWELAAIKNIGATLCLSSPFAILREPLAIPTLVDTGQRWVAPGKNRFVRNQGWFSDAIHSWPYFVFPQMRQHVHYTRFSRFLPRHGFICLNAERDRDSPSVVVCIQTQLRVLSTRCLGTVRATRWCLMDRDSDLHVWLERGSRASWFRLPEMGRQDSGSRYITELLPAENSS